EEALVRQALVLQSILESIGDGVAAADSNGQFFIVNSAAREISGIGEPVSQETWSDRFGIFRTLPQVGTVGLYGVVALAGIAFALALASHQRPRLLEAARNAVYATCALILFDILLLAYAFITHDFRVRYVAHYSDRTMPIPFLLTALWGGQDGSLLWWLFLLSIYTFAVTWWLRGKYRELQPFVLATLMAIVMFFVVIMGFAANPFSESIAGAKADGEGLNPLLQNFYMIIHPPSLYTGFVGCAIPFGFSIAALATGRLGEEWLTATRKWMLFAWTFLSIGNVLGMLWAYEELGWGGYWAWDPVENAAFMPWLTASAFVHSTMIQERRGMLKVWNVVLIGTTFFMTIWGTFLTRSGMISSVHAFAQSNIGVYFVYFMVTIASVTTALIVYRLPELNGHESDRVALDKYRAIVGTWLARILVVLLATAIFVCLQATAGTQPKMAPLGGLAVLAVIVMSVLGSTQRARIFGTARAGEIDSALSREAAFVANNWVLVAMQAFVCISTAFPLISESVTGEKVTVGPGFYNRWMAPLGLILFALMGAGPLLGWRKTSESALRKAFRIPLAAGATMALVHLSVGKHFGYPALVTSDPIYPGLLGVILSKVGGVLPLVATTLSAFNIAVIAQEYSRGINARMRTLKEGFFTALQRLISKQRRRYGGYIVHLGIVAMFLGFTGWAYKVDREFAVRPGESVELGGYVFKYTREHSEVDLSKRMVFVEVDVSKNGQHIATMEPAKFIYLRQRMPTTEVAIHPGPKEDLYIEPGNINPETKLATLHIHINPVTSWIWIGAMILLLGAAISTWPDATLGEVGLGAYLRMSGATAASLVFGLLLAVTPATAYAQQGGSSSSMAKAITLTSDAERQLFSSVLCMCGGCDRLPLSSCGCDWADEARANLRAKLAAGESIDQIRDEWVAKHGTSALNVPPSRGFLRTIWIVPSVLIIGGGAVAFGIVRRWTKRAASEADRPKPGAPADDYDAKLDAELRNRDGEQ
ncbi:MAG: cytochrome c-type biogenesis CcmF C-terminal domain-containing protein, partial [Polyangiales bacterium]